ncbi:MAG: VWA domain-containing protein [Streptosporangiales bacterium]|nr:VWA domain-containing protein [Streptosporangiales bacterium]
MTAAPDSHTAPGDLATVASRFGSVLHAAGLPVGPDRVERFVRAVGVARPATTASLRRCALATLVSGPEQVDAFDRVFAAVFGHAFDDVADRGDPNAPPVPGADLRRLPSPGSAGGGPPDADDDRRAPGAEEGRATFRALASGLERLGSRDFGELSGDELRLLADVMRALRLATPPRRSRRTRPNRHGRHVDLRATLRRARRTGGDPVRVARLSRRNRPRRLVVLCDISGSMEPYARAMLQLLYCAAGGRRAEVFTFATRLTRLTPLLRRTRPDQALERAGRAAPDWSGGTRIGEALAAFNERYGRRGMARGAVVLVISDGWDTGDPAVVGREMARLRRVAYRIVWANPRTQSATYRPLVGGMAAAWPYCDAVVSAHSLDALHDLVDALGRPRSSAYSSREER